MDPSDSVSCIGEPRERQRDRRRKRRSEGGARAVITKNDDQVRASANLARSRRANHHDGEPNVRRSAQNAFLGDARTYHSSQTVRNDVSLAHGAGDGMPVVYEDSETESEGEPEIDRRGKRSQAHAVDRPSRAKDFGTQSRAHEHQTTAPQAVPRTEYHRSNRRVSEIGRYETTPHRSRDDASPKGQLDNSHIPDRASTRPSRNPYCSTGLEGDSFNEDSEGRKVPYSIRRSVRKVYPYS